MKKVLVVSDDGSVLATNVRIVNGRHFTPNLLAKLLHLCQESSHPTAVPLTPSYFCSYVLQDNKLKLDSRKPLKKICDKCETRKKRVRTRETLNKVMG